MSPSNRASHRPPSRPSSTATRPRATTRTWVLVGALVVVLVVAVVVAVAASGGDDSSEASKGAVQVAPVDVSGKPLPDLPSSGTDPAVGSTIPTLSGTSLFDGAPMTIEPTGKPMVIVFLAHWCPHCQAEVPVLVDLARARAFDGIEVRAVATGTNSTAPNYPPSSWLEHERWPFVAMADDKGSTAAAAYGLTGYPYIVFVDASGKVVARSEGEVTAPVLEQALHDLRAGKAVTLNGSASSSR